MSLAESLCFSQCVFYVIHDSLWCKPMFYIWMCLNELKLQCQYQGVGNNWKAASLMDPSITPLPDGRWKDCQWTRMLSALFSSSLDMGLRELLDPTSLGRMMEDNNALLALSHLQKSMRVIWMGSGRGKYLVNEWDLGNLNWGADAGILCRKKIPQRSDILVCAQAIRLAQRCQFLWPHEGTFPPEKAQRTPGFTQLRIHYSSKLVHVIFYLSMYFVLLQHTDFLFLE